MTGTATRATRNPGATRLKIESERTIHPFGFRSSADADLIELGRELAFVLAQKDRVAAAAAANLTSALEILADFADKITAIIDKILTRPAYTIIGWRVKDQAIGAW